MVRLIDSGRKILNPSVSKFQFHDGTIDRMPETIQVETENKFQFHDGTIDRKTHQ